MKILSIDTSSKICSVSILENDTTILEKHNNDEKTHSQKLMPLISELFNETKLNLDNIDLLACCQGPGSFTGIRIGISTVKAFSDVKHIPVIGVTSLEALAYNIKKEGYIASIIDAKNDNVYFALYEFKNNTYKVIIPPLSTEINSILNQLHDYNNITFIGDGAMLHNELIASILPECSFSTENIETSINTGICAFNKFNDVSYVPEYSVSPVYLKKSQAEINLENGK